MEVNTSGKAKKCMNPEMSCPNIPDPASGYLIFYHGSALILCKDCGPRIQYKKITEERP
jgi:hypothetical protein